MPDSQEIPDGTEITVTARAFKANQVSDSGGGSSGQYYFTASAGMFSSANSFMSGLFSQNYKISIDVPSPTNEEGDIVVTATKEQVQAAKIAYEAAGKNIQIAQILGIIAAGFVDPRLAVGLAVGDKLIDFNTEALQNAYADILYYQDGLDGSYDGYAMDSGGWEGYDFRGGYSGPGPKTPPMPDDGYQNYMVSNDIENQYAAGSELFVI